MYTMYILPSSLHPEENCFIWLKWKNKKYLKQKETANTVLNNLWIITAASKGHRHVLSLHSLLLVHFFFCKVLWDLSREVLLIKHIHFADNFSWSVGIDSYTPTKITVCINLALNAFTWQFLDNWILLTSPVCSSGSYYMQSVTLCC